MKRIVIFMCTAWIMLAPSYAVGRQPITIAIANNFSQYATLCADPKGLYFRNAIDLAISDYLKAHPSFPYDIKLEAYDYGASNLDIIGLMNDVKKSEALAIIGFPCSDHALIAARLAQQNGIVMISPEATTDKLDTYNDYVFRTCFSNRSQARMLAEFAYKDLHARNIAAIVSSDCEYCTDISQTFMKRFKEIGGNDISLFKVINTDANYKDVVDEVRKKTYDALFIPNHELVTSKIIVQLAERHVMVPVLSGDAMGNVEGMLFKVLRNERPDVYATSHWFNHARDEASKRFRKTFVDTYSLEPNDNAVLAYDGMIFLLTGLANAQEATREGLRMALRDIQSLKGVHAMEFDRLHKSTSVSYYLLKAGRNRFEPIRVIEALNGAQ